MLTLPIKKQWFDMIASGEKLEEYRADTPYYDARLAKFTAAGTSWPVIFRNGYSKASPLILCLVKPRKSRGARAEWGGDPEALCWVLSIVSVLEIRNDSQAPEEVEQ